MKWIFLLLFYGSTLLLTDELNSANAQVLIDRDVHDFGDVTASSNRTTDFFIVNQYQFPIILSAFSFDMEYSTAHSVVSLEPGDTMIYRVKIIPKKEGLWEKHIPLSFFRLSDTLHIHLKANVTTTNFDDKTYLEPFDPTPGKNDEQFKDIPVQFRVLDLDTRRPIANAAISFDSEIPSQRSLKTNLTGYATKNLHNRYKVTVRASGYETATFGISLGCEDSIRTVLLAKYDPNKKRSFEYFYEYEANNPIRSNDSTNVINEEEAANVLKPFSEGAFKPNHIVFLMDVSVSMKDHDRMDLLKQSIIQLLELMRPSDRVSIITFSSDTKIILSPTLLSDDKKKVAIDIVSSLKPGGMTNGGKGLKTAFKLIRDNYNADQNNQVILATDGALGAYMKHEKIIEMVQKNVSFASTSVMTLNGYNWSGKFMRQIVRAGEGELIPINSAREAQLSLVKAIKKQAKIEE